MPTVRTHYSAFLTATILAATALSWPAVAETNCATIEAKATEAMRAFCEQAAAAGYLLAGVEETEACRGWTNPMTTGVLPGDAAQVCLADAQKQKEGTIFADEFDCASGAKPGGAWRFFDAWGKDKWRDAVYDDKHAKCDGNGNLVLTGEVENGQFRTSYLQTYDWLHPDAPGAGKVGPGKRIEARIDMSQMNCESCWGAFWLFDPTDPYDGNPANGTEIDIVERTVANDWAASRYTVNNHWSKEHGGSVGEWIEGADPSSGFHTYGLDWQANELVWYFDGKEVYRTTQGVSQSNNQAIVLSIENANGGNNPWAPGTKSGGSAKMVVDYVRVSETKP